MVVGFGVIYFNEIERDGERVRVFNKRESLTRDSCLVVDMIYIHGFKTCTLTREIIRFSGFNASMWSNIVIFCRITLGSIYVQYTLYSALYTLCSEHETESTPR